MWTKRFRLCVQWAIAATCVVVSLDDGMATSSLRACAARDRQILMLIEEREDANLITTQTLTDAMFTMMHARIVCHEGRVLDALALYDRIAANVSSERADRQGGDNIPDHVGSIGRPRHRLANLLLLGTSEA